MIGSAGVDLFYDCIEALGVDGVLLDALVGKLGRVKEDDLDQILVDKAVAEEGTHKESDDCDDIGVTEDLFRFQFHLFIL